MARSRESRLSRRDLGRGMGALACALLLPRTAPAASPMPTRSLEDFFGEANLADLRARFRTGKFWADTPREVPPVLGSNGRFQLSAEARRAYAAFLFDGCEAQFPAPHEEAEKHYFILHALRRYGLIGNRPTVLEARLASAPYTEIVILTNNP